MDADGVLSTSLPLPTPLPPRPKIIPKPEGSKGKGKKKGKGKGKQKAVEEQTETPQGPSIPDDSELGKRPSKPTNKYQVALADNTFTMYDYDLAPPGGVMSVNYSRYVLYIKYLFKYLLILLKTWTF